MSNPAARFFDPSVEELSDDLTRREVVEVLESIEFKPAHRLISIDRGVRDYLLRLVKEAGFR
jgi:hypothetical protein